MTSFDTLRTARRLRDAGVPEAHAEAFTEALRESREFDLSQLATKADLAELKGDLGREIAEAKFDLIKWVVGFGIVQTAALIGAAFAILKLFPGARP